jgi:hypothetical protein
LLFYSFPNHVIYYIFPNHVIYYQGFIFISLSKFPTVQSQKPGIKQSEWNRKQKRVGEESAIKENVINKERKTLNTAIQDGNWAQRTNSRRVDIQHPIISPPYFQFPITSHSNFTLPAHLNGLIGQQQLEMQCKCRHKKVSESLLQFKKENQSSNKFIQLLTEILDLTIA